MYNPLEIEKIILDFWKKHKTFDKLRQKIKGKKKWSFIDGPITANNPMGLHHAWGRTYKDLYQRFKAMQGYDQRFQNGFDCQGLWVEREEEKNLGLKDKKDIEKFGILNFVKACRKRVEKFSKIQTEQSIRLGQWMDWENSYYTMSDNNNLHNWFLIKTYFDNGWLYKGKGSVPWCWRCGTASSKHDIATEGYKEVTHTALFMRFPLKNKNDEYFLIFTTTPWTVAANVAIAVNSDLTYVKIDNDGKKYWLVESRLNEINGKYKIIDKKKGSELEGMEYIMPYKTFEAQKTSPHKVILWDLASGEEGTGIVHIAPGCGSDDFVLGKKLGLPVISPLDESGFYTEGYGSFSFKKYSEVNKEALKDLEHRGFVYKITQYKHRYPHCWRCGHELVFRLVDEWYVRCNEIRDNLIKENNRVNWFPEYGKLRQKEWFENMGDWLISRERYWGLPLPIWECSCGQIHVIGSLKELKEKAIDKKKVDSLLEIHRPWIDEIKIKCSKCENEVERIKDVGDAWLDAGIVPFSTLNYLTDKKHWESWFPADLISESIPGQCRGWFNALMWASAALTGKTPFKSVLGYETFKDEKGEEMHKSKGNAIWFDDAVEKIGADPMRLLYCAQDPAQDIRFGFDAVKEPKNNINILHNISNLITKPERSRSYQIEDLWILSRFNNLIKKVTYELECFRFHLATRALKDFWLNDLSRGYIQIVRDRLSDEDKVVNSVLANIYPELLKLCAPAIPFVTESLWQNLKEKKIVKEESVHLCEFPKPNKKLVDDKLESKFSLVRKVIEAGLKERDIAKVGLRWPLAKATISNAGEISSDLGEIIKTQLNVKEIELKNNKENGEITIKLDLSTTEELEAEGFAREVSRKIQAERKNRGFEKKDTIKLRIFCDENMKKMLEMQKDYIINKTGSEKIDFVDKSKTKVIFSIRDKEVGIDF